MPVVRCGSPEERDRALVGRDDVEDHADRRRLAGAVGPEEPVDGCRAAPASERSRTATCSVVALDDVPNVDREVGHQGGRVAGRGARAANCRRSAALAQAVLVQRDSPHAAAWNRASRRVARLRSSVRGRDARRARTRSSSSPPPASPCRFGPRSTASRARRAPSCSRRTARRSSWRGASRSCGRVPDVIALADQEVFPQLLVPRATSWYARFARNRMVVAYTDRSRGAAQLTAANWHRVLLAPRRSRRPQRSDGSHRWATARCSSIGSPSGYYRVPGLASRLEARTPPALIRANASELVALLQAGELDYILDYESLARANRLRFVALPPAIDLGDPARAREYARASVACRAAYRHRRRTGAPIVYAASVPRGAPHPAAGAARSLAVSCSSPAGAVGAARARGGRAARARARRATPCRRRCTRCAGDGRERRAAAAPIASPSAGVVAGAVLLLALLALPIVVLLVRGGASRGSAQLGADRELRAALCAHGADRDRRDAARRAARDAARVPARARSHARGRARRRAARPAAAHSASRGGHGAAARLRTREPGGSGARRSSASRSSARARGSCSRCCSSPRRSTSAPRARRSPASTSATSPSRARSATLPCARRGASRCRSRAEGCSPPPW